MLYKEWSINEQGWLTEARHCPSPFFNQRPQGEPVSLLGSTWHQLAAGAIRWAAY
jgi:hypothetical protein